MSFVFSGVQVASFAAAAFCTLVLPVVLLIVLAVMKKIRLAPLALGFVSFFVSQMVLRIPLLQLLNAAGALNAIAANTVLSKEKCGKCWARFFCGGGCAANAEAFNGDIAKPYDMECELERKRLECALAICAIEKLGAQADEEKTV